jgi:adenylyltransferase/sulfurtransferase
MVEVERILGLRNINEALLKASQSKKIALFGLGGLGCPVLLYLVASGYKNFTLIDFDTVDESNLARQILYKSSDIGKYKIEVAAKVSAAMNPEINFNLVFDRLQKDQVDVVAQDCDIIVDCTDNFDSRFQIAQSAKEARRTLISGAVIRYEGQVSVFKHQSNDPCYQCLYGQNNDPLENCSGQGVFSPLAGVIGTYMACEVMKELLFQESQLNNHLHIFDLKQNLWVKTRIPKNKNCLSCS